MTNDVLLRRRRVQRYASPNNHSCSSILGDSKFLGSLTKYHAVSCTSITVKIFKSNFRVGYVNTLKSWVILFQNLEIRLKTTQNFKEYTRPNQKCWSKIFNRSQHNFIALSVTWDTNIKNPESLGFFKLSVFNWRLAHNWA